MPVVYVSMQTLQTSQKTEKKERLNVQDECPICESVAPNVPLPDHRQERKGKVRLFPNANPMCAQRFRKKP